MIFVRDKGQMCNNLLQYAHLYAWGREHGKKTVSMRFAYKYQYFHICHTRWHWFITYLFAKWGAALHLIPCVTFPFEKGPDTTTQERKMLNLPCCVVEGWRVEYPMLFLKYRQEIVQLFTFNLPIQQKVKNWMDSNSSKESLRLGVHIRRGDYARWMEGKYYFTDHIYAAHITRFASLHPDRDVVVYISTNDKEVDVRQFRASCNLDSIHLLHGNAAEDLCMLSLCDYLIGPPSTYSLVASMYNDAPLYWMMNANAQEMQMENFRKFEQLFTQVL